MRFGVVGLDEADIEKAARDYQAIPEGVPLRLTYSDECAEEARVWLTERDFKRCCRRMRRLRSPHGFSYWGEVLLTFVIAGLIFGIIGLAGAGLVDLATAGVDVSYSTIFWANFSVTFGLGMLFTTAKWIHAIYVPWPDDRDNPKNLE